MYPKSARSVDGAVFNQIFFDVFKFSGSPSWFAHGGAHICQMFILLRLMVHSATRLCAAPAVESSVFLVSAFPASFDFIFLPAPLQASKMMSVTNVHPDLLLSQCILLRSEVIDLLQLTGYTSKGLACQCLPVVGLTGYN